MIKNIVVSVMKNSLDEINSKLETTEEKVRSNRKYPKCNTERLGTEPQWSMGQYKVVKHHIIWKKRDNRKKKVEEIMAENITNLTQIWEVHNTS